MHEVTKIALAAVAGGVLTWTGWVSLSIQNLKSSDVINGRQDDDIRELRATIQDLTVLVLQGERLVPSVSTPRAPGSMGPSAPGSSGPTPPGSPASAPPTTLPVPEFSEAQHQVEDVLRRRGYEPARKQ